MDVARASSPSSQLLLQGAALTSSRYTAKMAVKPTQLSGCSVSTWVSCVPKLVCVVSSFILTDALFSFPSITRMKTMHACPYVWPAHKVPQCRHQTRPWRLPRGAASNAAANIRWTRLDISFGDCCSDISSGLRRCMVR